MKTIIITLTLICSISYSFSQSTLIPDVNFEQALIDLNIDSDGLNGSILNSDALQINAHLDVSHKNISDLTGIEAFQNLETLDCSNNNLTDLDLSMNDTLYILNASANMLTSINLNGLNNLAGLDINNNQLTTIDLSDLSNLYYLYCYKNDISALNFSNNAALNTLSCGENQLSDTLDISNLFYLDFFSCYNNQLTHIKTSYLGISTFNCRNNNIKNIDFSLIVSGRIYIDSNDLFTVNLVNGNNTSILEFHAEGNPNLNCISVDDSTYSNSNINWFKDSHSFYSNNCGLLGLEETEMNEIKISPNPTSDFLKIELRLTESNFGEIVSMDGKLIKKFDVKESVVLLNVFDIENGVYFVKIGLTKSKFIKY